jgi:hypothetical protein
LDRRARDQSRQPADLVDILDVRHENRRDEGRNGQAQFLCLLRTDEVDRSVNLSDQQTYRIGPGSHGKRAFRAGGHAT